MVDVRLILMSVFIVEGFLFLLEALIFFRAYKRRGRLAPLFLSGVCTGMVSYMICSFAAACLSASLFA